MNPNLLSTIYDENGIQHNTMSETGKEIIRNKIRHLKSGGKQSDLTKDINFITACIDDNNQTDVINYLQNKNFKHFLIGTPTEPIINTQIIKIKNTE